MLLAGAVEPDFNRVVSHKIQIVSLRGTPPPPRSGAADAFKRFATDAEEMIRLGRGLDEVSFVVGQATHFVQNLNQPLHAAWGETRAEHNEVEAQMLYRSWQKDHTYRGFMLVKNYSCFAHEIAQNSSQHARAHFFDPDRLDQQSDPFPISFTGSWILSSCPLLPQGVPNDRLPEVCRVIDGVEHRCASVGRVLGFDAEWNAAARAVLGWS
jgi:hypothetical protein